MELVELVEIFLESLSSLCLRVHLSLLDDDSVTLQSVPSTETELFLGLLEKPEP